MPPSPPPPWPTQDLEVLARCPLCDQVARTLLHAALTDRLFGCAPGTWQLHTCMTCQVAYLDPRPTSSSIGRAYASYFTHTEGRQTGLPVRRQRLQDAARAALNSYRNARWRMRLPGSSRWGRWLVPLAWPVRNLLIAHMRNLPVQPPRPDARLLDVGCGSGAYLELARGAGWQVQGMDFDPQAVAMARSRGLDVRHGGLEQFADHPDTFDRLTCSHVIEHVHDPRRWVRDMHAMLRPGGTLWLQTPNIASRGHAHYGADWRGLEPPRHLVLFTPDTLRRVLEAEGFEVRLLPMPMLMAVPVYDASRKLAHGRPHDADSSWRSLAHLPTLWRALQQSLRVGEAEFITVEAKRR